MSPPGRLAQGLSTTVEDPIVLAKVAALVTRNGNAGPHHKAGATNIISDDTAKAGKRGRRERT